jgi:hypothetical protein
MMRFRAILMMALPLLALMAGCANEQSEEQRVREDVTRMRARLSKATGDYYGYVQRDEHHIVPVRLFISVQSHPVNGKDSPELQANLTIGLFGGVQIASSAASFDWGEGRLAFTFARGAGSRVGVASSDKKDDKSGGPKALEIRAYVQDGKLHDAVLDAPRQGVFPLVISQGGPHLFTSQTKFDFSWLTPAAAEAQGTKSTEPPALGINPDAIFTLNLTDVGQPSPGNLDLPYVPGIVGTIRFSPLGKAPETAKGVIYDPIGGTFDAFFGQVGLVHFNDVFLKSEAVSAKSLPPSSPLLSPSTLRGTIALGSVNLASVLMSQIDEDKALDIHPTPARRYRGIYAGNGIEYRAEVYVDYLGTQKVNTSEFPFPEFPAIRLEMVLCVGEEPQRRRVLNLVSVDHLNGIASFSVVGSPNPKDLELKYTPNWSSLDGKFMEGDGLGTVRPRLSVTPRTFEGDECAEDSGT